MTTQWERLLPREFRERFDALPVLYLPLGTVEWHGEHNALGLDSLKAHALCMQAAERALVRVQTALWRTHQPWQAWRHLIERQQFDYGKHLAAGDFAAIAALAEALR